MVEKWKLTDSAGARIESLVGFSRYQFAYRSNSINTNWLILFIVYRSIVAIVVAHKPIYAYTHSHSFTWLL